MEVDLKELSEIFVATFGGVHIGAPALIDMGLIGLPMVLVGALTVAYSITKNQALKWILAAAYGGGAAFHTYSLLTGSADIPVPGVDPNVIRIGGTVADIAMVGALLKSGE